MHQLTWLQTISTHTLLPAVKRPQPDGLFKPERLLLVPPFKQARASSPIQDIQCLYGLLDTLVYETYKDEQIEYTLMPVGPLTVTLTANNLPWGNPIALDLAHRDSFELLGEAVVKQAQDMYSRRGLLIHEPWTLLMLDQVGLPTPDTLTVAVTLGTHAMAAAAARGEVTWCSDTQEYFWVPGSLSN